MLAKKSKFTKTQGDSGLLTSSGIKKPLSKIPLLDPLLFLVYKVNEIVNKFLLAEDKSMPEMFLRPGFIYIACGPFTKKKERIRKFKETIDSRYVYENELDKACFQHNMAYGCFKNLTRRTTYEKILHDKAFIITKYQKYERYQRGIASVVYKCF